MPAVRRLPRASPRPHRGEPPCARERAKSPPPAGRRRTPPTVHVPHFTLVLLRRKGTPLPFTNRMFAAYYRRMEWPFRIR